MVGGRAGVRSRRRNRNPFWRLRRLLFVLALLAVTGLAAGVALLSRIELPPDDFASLVQTSFVCTAEVREGCAPEVATAQLSAGEDRELVPYESIPPVLIQAVVAAEDKEFFRHPGVDPFGIARALYRDLRNEGVQQGGSTITQQYVKNAFLTPERTLVRKVREAVLAVKLERELTKEEILGRYLNRIYFGRGAYGVEAASQTYFGKSVRHVDLAEAAYLAGLIRAPETADAERRPEEASRRRASVLVRMVDDGYITQAQADEANARPWGELRPRRSREGLGDVRGSEYGTEYFVEAVRQQVVELFPDGQVYSRGLRIYTTLDHDRQRDAHETVVGLLDPDNPDDPDASILAVDRRGRVVAMMAGTDFGRSQVNLALGQQGGGSGRQPGSAFKTFALAEAIEQGFSARSLYEAPSSIVLAGANSGQDWRVSGGASPAGFWDLVDALRISSNTVYAQLMLDVGPDSVVELAHRLGIRSPIPAVNALVLGAGEVSVLDMAIAYNTLANEGLRYQPMLIERIEDASGEVLCWWPSEGRCSEVSEPLADPALDPAIARQVNYALSQVVANGTGRRAAYGNAVAGKTGTTQDNRDAWFVGFGCELTTAVWMGYAGAPGEEPRYMDSFRGMEVQGGGFPAELFSRFMARASQGQPPCTLPVQSNFPGIVLNTELSTTTTLPPCPLPVQLAEGEEPSAEPAPQPGVDCDPSTTPTTTAPPEPVATEPDDTQPEPTEPPSTPAPTPAPTTPAPPTTTPAPTTAPAPPPTTRPPSSPPPPPPPPPPPTEQPPPPG
jgi:membrane peptidoglycan carboxypeptidase